MPILTSPLKRDERLSSISWYTRLQMPPTVCHSTRINSETALREACTLSHAAVSSKLLVNRLPCLAQGTAAVTTLCFGQHTRGDSASTYIFSAPISRHRQRRFPRPLSYNGALRRHIPHRHFSRLVGCTDSIISFISAWLMMSFRTNPAPPMMCSTSSLARILRPSSMILCLSTKS